MRDDRRGRARHSVGTSADGSSAKESTMRIPGFFQHRAVAFGGITAIAVLMLAGTLSGSLAEFDAPEVQLSCPVDVELATQSIVALHDDGLPVVGASFGANDPAAATAPMVRR